MCPRRQVISMVFAAAEWLQAGILFITGLGVLWYSDSLMLWLIHLVGEEQALGAENVVQNNDGSRLLTNPGAMLLWTAPFWIVGILQITASITLATYALRRPSPVTK
jgi:hypothetical protein